MPEVAITLRRAGVVTWRPCVLLLVPLLTGCSPTSIRTDETREVTAGGVEAVAPDGSPKVAAAWAGRDRITVTTWGSSSCATRPVRIERTGPQQVQVEVRATDGRDDCTLDLSPTSSTVALPEGMDDGAPLDVVVDDGGGTRARLTLPPSSTG